jgi:hypothetical protein
MPAVHQLVDQGPAQDHDVRRLARQQAPLHGAHRAENAIDAPARLGFK